MSVSSSKPQVETNPRGIPRAPFVSNVEEYLGPGNNTVESTLAKFQEMIAKYRYMELNVQNRRKGLDQKLPDIEKTLAMVEFLKDRRTKTEEEDMDKDLDDDGVDEAPLKTTFELNDTLYAEAEISEMVYLWLGANVMLAYPLNEAHDLLSSKLATAQQSRSNAIEDMEWLREQITVMEVNLARVYNWDVRKRREAKGRGLEAGDTEK
ncbi:Prefoldin subunit 3 [Dacryopinax primogenitus]|uniref:Prefoldin subunit 3 n=1 Tax=Dacryopinax primogenitus (strain DJM 731) TaxID=1858805 RepID=M5FX25_DACPD|nr:Prefoldin subunit 3 [Dacryopinax primogenitus]EJU00265.1 Prefoldin subunit 3 [Dacryopinax primogenitus]